MDPVLAAVIDHTVLGAAASEHDIVRACDDALEWEFSGVVVSPFYLPVAIERLAGSKVKACTVVSFPFGGPYADGEGRRGKALCGGGRTGNRCSDEHRCVSLRRTARRRGRAQGTWSEHAKVSRLSSLLSRPPILIMGRSRS